MFTSKFYVDTKRNNALMVRIINNRKKVELSMGFQMDEETLANAMSDKPKPKNLRYKSLLSHWQAIIEDLKIDLVRQHKSDMDVNEIKGIVSSAIFGEQVTVEQTEPSGQFVSWFCKFAHKAADSRLSLAVRLC